MKGRKERRKEGRRDRYNVMMNKVRGKRNMIRGNNR